MKTLTETEKTKFKKAGIIEDENKKYYVDIKERVLISESDLMAHFNADSDRISVMIAEEDCNRVSGVRTFTLSEISGAIKF